jgi:hypothetical protein
MYETDAGSMSLSYTWSTTSLTHAAIAGLVCLHTGTFFCEITTAQSLPRTPTEVMFAAVIALKAYSRRSVSGAFPLAFHCNQHE